MNAPHTIQALPKQIEFLQAKEREVMYSGAVRAGKTYSLCLKVVERTLRNKQARELLVRKTLPSLKGSTLKTLLEGDGPLPPVLPPGTYTHNKADKSIRIKGGGEIMYLSMTDGEGNEQRVGSFGCTGVGVDEVIELQEREYNMLHTRISLNVEGVPNQLYSVTNPSGPMHFLAKRFAAPGSGYSTPRPNCRCISTGTRDNFFLTKEYQDSLAYDDGTLYHRRMVLGFWCGSDALVYDRWDRNIHVAVRRFDPARVVIGVDDGYTNPFSANRIEFDNDGRAHVSREIYGTKMQREEKIEAVRSLMDGADSVIVDSASPELIDSLRNADLPAVACEKGPDSVYNQITQIVQPRLIVAGDGAPRFTVDPSCENLVKEFETHEWNPKKDDEPIDKWNHGLSAVRYGLTYVDGTDALELAGGARTHRTASEVIEAINPDPLVSLHSLYEEARKNPNFGFDDADRSRARGRPCRN